jgi:hypothetical protein
LDGNFQNTPENCRPFLNPCAMLIAHKSLFYIGGGDVGGFGERLFPDCDIFREMLNIIIIVARARPEGKHGRYNCF